MLSRKVRAARRISQLTRQFVAVGGPKRWRRDRPVLLADVAHLLVHSNRVHTFRSYPPNGDRESAKRPQPVRVHAAGRNSRTNLDVLATGTVATVTRNANISGLLTSDRRSR